MYIEAKAYWKYYTTILPFCFMQWQLQEKQIARKLLFQKLNQVDLFVHSVIYNIYQDFCKQLPMLCFSLTIHNKINVIYLNIYAYLSLQSQLIIHIISHV